MFIPIWEYDYMNNKQDCIDLILMHINMVFYNSENKSIVSF